MLRRQSFAVTYRKVRFPTLSTAKNTVPIPAAQKQIPRWDPALRFLAQFPLFARVEPLSSVEVFPQLQDQPQLLPLAAWSASALCSRTTSGLGI